jgi:hypothetical protein
VSIDDIRAAARRIEGIAVRTPALSFPVSTSWSGPG